MPYIFIEDFKGGVDRRKARVSGIPGTLWDGINCHITRGGDIEKRKAFVAAYALPSGTFGFAAASGERFVFGSGVDPGTVPAGVTYQRLQHPDGLAMAGILDWDVSDGSIYAIAEYADGSVHHFFDGARVVDWDDGVVRLAMVNNDGIATHLAALIDSDDLYVSTALGSTVTIEAATAGVPFTISASTANGGAANDQALTVNETQANVTGTAEVVAIGSLKITAGTSSAGVNKVSGIKIDGVEIMSGAVDWTASHSTTAVAIAANITAHTSTPNYSAVANGSTVTISAAAGSGDTPNGFVIAATVGGDVTVGSVVNMAGGVDAAGNQKQIVEVLVSGSFEVGDRFTITLNGIQFGAGGKPTPKGRTVLSFKTKIYAGSGGVLEYSGAATPTQWNADEDIGAGFESVSSQASKSETITGLGIYEGTNLAIFSDRAIQTWFVDVDEERNALLRVLPDTGTRAQGSVLSFGTSDVFYLDDSGIRSLRARDSSGAPFASDVGSAIDPLVIEFLATLTDAQIVAAKAIIDPLDGRYWLAVDDQMFVFSYFPGAKISAWSTYELPGPVVDFGIVGKRIYLRIGDTIYLYGGDDNATFDTSRVTVGMPFLDIGKPAHKKELTGFDAALTNTWAVKIKTDPNNTDLAVDVGTIDDITYKTGTLSAVGEVTHFAPVLICEEEGPATISNICVHYSMQDAD